MAYGRHAYASSPYGDAIQRGAAPPEPPPPGGEIPLSVTFTDTDYLDISKTHALLVVFTEEDRFTGVLESVPFPFMGDSAWTFSGVGMLEVEVEVLPSPEGIHPVTHYSITETMFEPAHVAGLPVHPEVFGVTQFSGSISGVTGS